MKLKILTILIFSAFSFQFSAFSSETISSTELIEKAKEFDGKEVIYEGEAITAILNRGQYSWVNLNDGQNAIGVWSKTSDLEQVKFIGGYKRKGDILRVEGRFNRTCAFHGGEMDIHTEVITMARHGYVIKEHVDNNKLILSISSFLVVLLVVLLFRKRI